MSPEETVRTENIKPVIGSEEEIGEAIGSEEKVSEKEAQQAAITPSEQDLDAAVAALEEKNLRLLAEMENLKKRHTRETQEAISFGNRRLLKDLLGVLDNFERAATVAAQQPKETIEGGFKVLLEGVELIQKELNKFLENNHVSCIDAEKAVFDPHIHEAMQEEKSDVVPAGQVLRVLQKGYMLANRLLRPALVVVSKGSDKK